MPDAESDQSLTMLGAAKFPEIGDDLR